MNKQQRNTARSQRRAAVATKRRKSRVVPQQQYVKVFDICPSTVVEKDEEGKVTNWNSWNRSKSKGTYTETAMNARAELKKQAELFILQVSKLIDPSLTGKAKTHALKKAEAKLFDKPKVVITTEQALLNIEARKAKRAAEFEKRRYLSPFGKGHKQPLRSASEVMAKEKADERQFKFVIMRNSDEHPGNNYEYATNYFKAPTKREAIKKLKRIASTYKKDSSFNGIRLQDSKDNLISYFNKEKLFSSLDYAA